MVMFGGASLFLGGSKTNSLKAQLEKEGMPYIDFSNFNPEQVNNELPNLREFNLSHILEHHLSYELSELKKALIETSKNYRIDLSSLIASILTDQNEKVLPKLKHVDAEVESYYQKVKMMNNKVLKNKNNLQKSEAQIAQSMEEIDMLTGKANDLICSIIGDIDKLSDNNLSSSESIDHFKYPLLSKLLIKKRKENSTNIDSKHSGNNTNTSNEKDRETYSENCLSIEGTSRELPSSSSLASMISPREFPTLDSFSKDANNINSFTKNLFGNNQFSLYDKDNTKSKTPSSQSFEQMKQLDTNIINDEKNQAVFKTNKSNAPSVMDNNEVDNSNVLSPEEEMAEIKNLLDMRNLEREQYASPVTTQNVFSDEETNEFEKMIKYNETISESTSDEKINEDSDNWVSSNIGKYLGLSSLNNSSKNIAVSSFDNYDNENANNRVRDPSIGDEEVSISDVEISPRSKSEENDELLDQESAAISQEQSEKIVRSIHTHDSISNSSISLSVISQNPKLSMFSNSGGLKFQSPTDIISSFKPSDPKPIVTAVNIIDKDRGESFSNKADAVLLKVQKQDQESFSSKEIK